MKKFLILLLSISLLGCATMKQMENQGKSMQNRDNLQGMTQQQILDKYGNPNNSSTSHSLGVTWDTWTYRQTNMFGRAYYMIIMFKNWIVCSVNYNEY